MHKLNAFLLTTVFGLLIFSSAFAIEFYHSEPGPVLVGETLRLELTYSESRVPVSNVFFFYRMQGEHNFRSIRMRQEGMVLSGEVNTAKLHPGDLEYYFAYQDAEGQVKYLPEQNPENNPYKVKILPAKSEGIETADDLFIPLLLSPAPGELVPSDELVIAFSIPFEVNPEKLTYKLFIGGVDVSKMVQREGSLITFSPKTIRSGLHNAELKVLDDNGKIVGKNQLSFRVSGEVTEQSGFEVATRIFLDNRYETINNVSDNFFRGGINFSGSYKKFLFKAHALISSEESYNLQPVNQYSVGLSYIFNERNDIYLKAGDFSTNYDQLSFWEKRIRGFGAGFHTSFFDFDYTVGQNFKAVEGKLDSEGEVDRYATYEQSFVSFRPQFNFGQHFSWAFNLVNSKDDPGSIKDTTAALNPKESLVVGTSFALNLDKKRILLKGSVQGSIKNTDAGGEAVDLDSLANKYDMSESDVDQIRPFVDFMESTGFLTLTPGLAPMPNLAMQFETQIRYFGNDLRATYKRIDAEYVSPGNPYLRKDIAGLFLSDNFRFYKNQILLNAYYNNYAENLEREDEKTQNQAIGASLSYFPFSNLPSITLNYNTHSRKNDIESDSPYYAEDNKNQSYGISSTYNFATGSVKNTLMLNLSKFDYTDAENDNRNSDFILFSLGIRNRFAIPLTSRLTYARTTTDLFIPDTTANSGYTAQKTAAQKFNLGLDYLIRNFMTDTDLKPYMNVSIQLIENDTKLDEAAVDYSRNFYSAGVYLRNKQWGTLSLRYDYINYGDLKDWNDSILSARYDVAF